MAGRLYSPLESCNAFSLNGPLNPNSLCNLLLRRVQSAPLIETPQGLRCGVGDGFREGAGIGVNGAFAVSSADNRLFRALASGLFGSSFRTLSVSATEFLRSFFSS